MIAKLLSLIKWLVPPEEGASANHILGWRWAVAGVAAVALSGVLIIFGALERIGIYGFARADEIDQKIEKALMPVNSRLTTIEANQVAQSIGIKRLVKSDISKDIHAEKMAWCRAETSTEKQRIREKIDELQEEYEDVAGPGKRATEPDCEP